MVLHEEGFVVVCCLCDTYFVLTTGYVAPASYRGKAGTERLDTRNEQIQKDYAQRRWTMLRCPTCVEVTTGIAYLDWIEKHARNIDSLAPMSPCAFVTFDDEQPPPLYMDYKPAGEAGKPKWKLASGVGPAGLEMDNSKSGRIWKPSLRQVGIDAPRYSSDAADQEYHADILQRVETALAFLSQSDKVDELYEMLRASRPCFSPQRWQSVVEAVGSAAEESDAVRISNERAQQLGWSEKRRRDHSLDMAMMGMAELS
jgi:hypothetical protein